MTRQHAVRPGARAESSTVTANAAKRFSFDDKQSQSEAQSGQLNNVIINYSGRERKDVVAAGRMIAAATGLSADDVAKIGRDSAQSFHWERQRVRQRYFFAMEVHLTQRAMSWELNVNIGRHQLDEVGKPDFSGSG